MNPHQVKQQISVSVRIKEPLLRAGACAALREAPGIVLIDGDDAAPPSEIDVLVVDGSAVAALVEGMTGQPGQNTHPRVLVIATTAREHAIRSAFSQGILGIVLSTSTLGDFIAGIRAVAKGETFLCRALACQIADARDRDPLTPREDDVLQLLAQGLCNKSIGRSLDIATETAKFHVRSIMLKLNAKTRTEVASIAISCGMTEHFALSLPKHRHSAAPAPYRTSSSAAA